MIQSLFYDVKEPVLGLNYTKQTTEKYITIKQLANHFVSNVLMVKYKHLAAFNIIGHSFGGIVAHEVALILEHDHGKKVKILSIDRY